MIVADMNQLTLAGCKRRGGKDGRGGLTIPRAVAAGTLLCRVFGWLGGNSVSGLINMDITSNQVTCSGIRRQKLNYHYLRVFED
jgi:hypothetical protein